MSYEGLKAFATYFLSQADRGLEKEEVDLIPAYLDGAISKFGVGATQAVSHKKKLNWPVSNADCGLLFSPCNEYVTAIVPLFCNPKNSSSQSVKAIKPFFGCSKILGETG